jgi:hypothetical protein
MAGLNSEEIKILRRIKEEEFDIKGIKQESRYHSNFQNINIYIYTIGA